MSNFYILIIRTILGCGFAVIISNFSSSNPKIINILALAIIMVSLAYLAEFFRTRKKK